MNIKVRALLSSTAIFMSGWSVQAYGQSVTGDLAAGAASNFSRDRNVAVTQRPREGYEAVGLPLGAFRAFPKLTVSAEHNDNIYGSGLLAVDDNIIRLQPEISVNSGWSRHSLNVYGRGNFSRYQEHDTENSEEWIAGANGQLDVLKDLVVTLGLESASLVEPRTSATSPVAAVSPIEFSRDQLNLAVVKEFNRLKVSGRVDYLDLNYKDGLTALGGVVEQDDRDRVQTILTGRADYAISPDTAVFVQVALNDRNYKLSPPATSLNRDSTGVEALLGVNFELGALMTGEVGIGYISQKYDAPTLPDVNGLGVRAQVEWFPTDLTTVTLSGNRYVDDSGLAGDGGLVISSASLQVDHELLRNLILKGQVSFSDQSHEGVAPRTDKIANVQLGATYLMNRTVGLTVTYNHLDQDSTAPFASFEQNRIAAGLTLQF